jgi:sporulation protein YlmC with PRC-barrel domain
MMNIQNSIPRSCLLVAVAGLTASIALAQQSSDRNDPHKRDAMSQQVTKTGRHFCRASDLMKATVNNPSGEKIGDVKDFIFDRGTGRVEYALVESGSILGLGGKTIAVAYSSLGCDEANKRYTLDMTPRSQPERSDRKKQRHPKHRFRKENGSRKTSYDESNERANDGQEARTERKEGRR